MDFATLRKCFVVYAAFNKVDFSEVSYLSELKFDAQQFRQELIETLAHGSVNESPSEYLEKLLSGCQEKLSTIIPFNEKELQFLTAVNKKGEIKADLLTDSQELIDIIKAHPMLQWKVFNVRKHYGL